MRPGTVVSILHGQGTHIAAMSVRCGSIIVASRGGTNLANRMGRCRVVELKGGRFVRGRFRKAEEYVMLASGKRGSLMSNLQEHSQQLFTNPRHAILLALAPARLSGVR